MNQWQLLVGLIAVIIVVMLVFAVTQKIKLNKIRKKHPGYPKGYWINQGVGIGVAVGVAFGAAVGNMGLGIAIGIAIGAAIGSGLEKKHKDEIRPLTAEEEKLKKQSILFTMAILTAGIIVFAITYFVFK